MGAKCCVNPHLMSGESLTPKHYGLEIHGSRKSDPPPPKEVFLFQEWGMSFSHIIFLLEQNYPLI